MCGFVSILHDDPQRPVDPVQLRAATDALEHRGPDDEGFYDDGPLGMGFRRLAILDLSPAGHQPMHSACGRYVITFNGEIYNFIELRSELESAGHTFGTESDTEVILAAFRHWGTGCFARFNGMWALCIWDKQERLLTFSRDRFGIKPLYIAHRQDRWLLGSELPALRHLDPLPRLPDLLQATDYLIHGFTDHDNNTAIEGYQRVPPATFGTLKAGARQPTYQPFYNLDAEHDEARTQRIISDTTGRETSALAEELRDAIVDAVKLRMRSDVPVGTCLSGGLDSGSIVCATAQVAEEARSSNARHAFSAMMPQFDETIYINAVMQQTGVKLTKADLTAASVRETAEQVLTFHDEPIHTLTPIAGSLVFKAAREQGVTVLLNGQGADELLAGYGSYVSAFLHTTVHQQGPLDAVRQWRHEGVRRGDAFTLARQLAGGPGAAISKVLRGFRGQRQSLVAAEVVAGTKGRLWTDRKRISIGLNEALDESITGYPLPLYLRVEDRNAMSWSREARLPYLDPRIVRLCRTAPASLKRRDGLNKWLQREALKGVIPELVRTRRDKMGFPAPHGTWMRGPLRDLVMDVLSEERLRMRGIYNVRAVVDARDQLMASDSIAAPPAIMRAFLYEGWARRHLDVESHV
jgi:asparagine synthase (glutamine-hydrolysing)